MHRSRIGVVLVDHPAVDQERGLAFWAGVQGVEPTPAGEEPYRSLGTIGSLMFEHQRLGDDTEPRVHLDIESDDVPAEVDRVVALGATVVEAHDEYTILRDPAGLLFCVVPVQTGDDFEAHAVTWP
jgi:predicted enzyme related to lactoylglutathione lyase